MPTTSSHSRTIAAKNPMTGTKTPATFPHRSQVDTAGSYPSHGPSCRAIDARSLHSHDAEAADPHAWLSHRGTTERAGARAGYARRQAMAVAPRRLPGTKP